LTPEIKENLILGIERQGVNMSELKNKRDHALIEILKAKKANEL